MITNPNLSTILDNMSRLMDGQPFPAAGSEETDKLQRAIGGFLKHQTSAEVQQLGAHALGLLIDRARASIATEIALRDIGGAA